MDPTRKDEEVLCEEALSPLLPFELSSPTPSESAFVQDSVLGEMLNNEAYAPLQHSEPTINKREAPESSDSLMAEFGHQQPPKLQRGLQLNMEFTVPITNNSYACFNPEKIKVYAKLNKEFPVEFTWNKGLVDLTDLVVRATLELTSDRHKALRRCLTHSSQVDPARGVLEAGVDEKNVIYELDRFDRPSIIVPAVDKSDDLEFTVLIRVNYVFRCLNTCFIKHIHSLLDNETHIIFTIEKRIDNESIIYGKCRLMCKCTEKPKRKYKEESKSSKNEAKASSSHSMRSTRTTSALPTALLTPPQTSEDEGKNQFYPVPLPHQVLEERLLSIPYEDVPNRQKYENSIELLKSLEDYDSVCNKQ